MSNEKVVDEKLPNKVERFWAATTHFSFFLYIPLAFIGGNWLFIYTFTIPIAISIVPLICFIIYLNFKKRSRYTAFHSLQALIFHPIFPSIVMTVNLGFNDWFSSPESANSAAIIFAMCSIPIYIMPMLSLLNGIQTALGNGFKYPLIGTWVEERLFNSETQKQ